MTTSRRADEQHRSVHPSGAASTPDAWDRAPVGLLRLDADGAVLAANRTLLRWLRRGADDVVGVRLGSLLTVGGRIYWDTHVAPLLRLRGELDQVAVELRGADGALPVLLSAHLVQDGIDVALTANAERELLERELLAARRGAEDATAHVELLQRSTAALSLADGVEAASAALLVTAVETFGAGGAGVWLTDDAGALVRTRAVGAATTAPGPVVAHDAASAHDDGYVVPLSGPHGLAGALVLAPPAGPVAGWPPDLRLLTAIGRQAGVALERAATQDRSASVAHELQLAMLGVDVPDDPRYAVTAVYRPGVEALDVGGDWYDVVPVRDGVVAVTVGDVVGRGLAAATTMGQLRSAVRALAGDVPPGELLSRLDRFVQRTGVGFMTTIAHAEVDLRTGVVRYACAGHLPPLVVGREATFLWDGRSAPLGVGAGVRTDAEARLAPGDRLVLCTDGLVERRDRPLDAGLEALAGAALALGPRPLDRFVVDALVEPGEHDDVCLLALTWHP